MNKLKLGKHRRAIDIILISLVVVLAVVLNILLPYLQHLGNVVVDLTPEGLYTMSPEMDNALKETFEEVDTEILITFCADPDYLMSNTETRLPYILARQMASASDNITVRTVSLVHEPEAVEQYKNTRITDIAWNDCIVSAGEQYKVVRSSGFWSSEEGEKTHFNGEYRFATTLLSLTAFKDGPQAVFTKGHGERYYDMNDPTWEDNKELSSFVSLLLDLGLSIDTVDLTVEDIPDDTALLIMFGPTKDFVTADPYDYAFVSPLEKIDRFLADKYQSLMIFRDPFVGELPELNEYLAQWGLALGNDVVRDASVDGAMQVVGGNADDEREYLIAQYADKSSPIGYAMYSAVADLDSAPKTVVESTSSIDLLWGDAGETVITYNTTRMVSGVFYSSDKANSYDENDYRNINKTAPFPIAAVSAESRLGEEAEYHMAYVFACGTTEFVSPTYLESNAYGNYDILYSIVRTISRTDVYADSSLGGPSLNSEKYGGKALLTTKMTATGWEDYPEHGVEVVYHGMTEGTQKGLTVLVFFLPVILIPATGVVMYLRRRYR